MLGKSVKKSDSLKIGQFGQGFKSVFHITDLPCILSGDSIVLLDPLSICFPLGTRQINFCNARHVLHQLEHQFLPFYQSIFGGLNRNMLSSGRFEGTIFRFPLREGPQMGRHEKSSKLCDTLYNPNKVQKLFLSLQNDAHDVLLFLSHLKRIEVYERKYCNTSDGVSKIFRIDVASGHEDRLAFFDKVANVRKGEAMYAKACYRLTTELTVEKGITEGGHLEGSPLTEKKMWCVSQYCAERDIKIKEIREKLGRKFLQKNLPWVGVAVQVLADKHLTQNISFTTSPQGRVFCFLPLPADSTEGRTGLHTHVHGYFSLDENRRHIKWPSQSLSDNKNPSVLECSEGDAEVTDKYLLWNKYLIEYLLPIVTVNLVEFVADSCGRKPVKGNDLVPETIFDAIPNPGTVSSHWQSFLPIVHEQLDMLTIFHTAAGGGRWVKITDEGVLIDEILTEECDELRSLIHKILLTSGRYLVTLPRYLLDIFLKFEKSDCEANIDGKTKKTTRVQPIHVCESYKEVSKNSDSLNIDDNDLSILLKFLLHGLTDYSSLIGSRLLPLADGTWTTFITKVAVRNAVYIDSSEHPMTLIPGSHSQFLRRGCIETLEQKERTNSLIDVTQLKYFKADDVARMLTELDPPQCDDIIDSDITKDILTSMDENWLEALWLYLNKNFKHDLSAVECLHIIPFDNTKRARLKGKNPIMLANHAKLKLSREESSAIKRCGVSVMDKIPEYISKHSLVIDNYILLPLASNFIDALSDIQCANYNFRDQMLLIFSALKESEKLSLSRFITNGDLFRDNNYVISLERMNVIRMLPIFKTLNGSGFQDSHFVSLESLNVAAPFDDQIPVHLPKRMLDLRDNNDKQLAQSMGVKQASITEVLLNDVFTEINRTLNHEVPEKNELCTNYRDDEIQTVMIYTLENRTRFERICTGFSAAVGRIRFIRTKSGIFKAPSELFDPQDEELTVLLTNLDVFPFGEFLKQEYHESLVHSGLRGIKSLHAYDIMLVVESLNVLSDTLMQNIDSIQLYLRAQALLRYLNGCDENIFQTVINGETLLVQLKKHKWIPALQSRPDQYPESLHFAFDKHLNLPIDVCSACSVYLIGSMKPVIFAGVECSNIVSKLECSSLPDISDVIGHLFKICHSYNNREHLKFQFILDQVYEFMNERIVLLVNLKEANCKTYNKLLTENWIWHGCGFTCLAQVMRNEARSCLKPYMFHLPEQFKRLTELWEHFQVADTYNPIVVLQKIAVQHESDLQNGFAQVEIDLKMVVDILDCIANSSEASTDNQRHDQLLIPICTENRSLQLKPILECVYGPDRSGSTYRYASDSEPSFYNVHSSITFSTAASLKIHNLVTRQLDADEIEDFGQSEPLTTRLHNILRGYTDGLAIFKELIQNADDAGASEIKFLYDERTNMDAQNNLIDVQMAELQGPALWVFNNKEFTDADFVNITKLGAATKEKSRNKIGRFGVGFNAVYNLTDMPSFISRNYMVIFDPHTTYLGNALRDRSKPGIKLDFQKNPKIHANFSGQFKPFNGIFNCFFPNVGNSTMKSYNGTLFRFPLRTHRQAQSSAISEICYTPDKMKTLLNMLRDSGGHLLLFTQHIKSVSAHHIPVNGIPSEMKLCFKIEKHVEKMLTPGTSSENLSILKQAENLLQNNESMNESQDVSNSYLLKTDISNFDSDLTDCEPRDYQHLWLVSESVGKGSSVDMALKDSTLTPVGGVAITLSRTQDGHIAPCLKNVERDHDISSDFSLFCFLPLPIQTSFPVHINGYFALASDRRNLCTTTCDDRLSTDCDWNETLFEDPVMLAYCLALQEAAKLCLEISFQPYSVWPVAVSKSSLDRPHWKLVNQLYAHLYSNSEARVVCENKALLALHECYILDSEFRQIPLIGDLALLVIRQVDKRYHIIDLPSDIIRTISQTSAAQDLLARTISKTKFYSKWFLPNIAIFDKKTTDHLVIHLLFDTINRELLKNHQCIPVEPTGTCFKKPCELIHPDSDISQLYDIEDERFPKFIEESYADFAKLNFVYENLKELGMAHDELDWEEIAQRCQFATKCEKRLDVIMKLMTKQIETDVDKHIFVQAIAKIRDTPFLPTIEMPCHHSLNWFAQNIPYTSCNAAYTQDHQHLVSCSFPIINTRCAFKFANNDLIKHLGLYKKSVSESVVLKQLNAVLELADKDGVISLDGNQPYSAKTELKMTISEIYKFFDVNTSETTIANLKKRNCILVDYHKNLICLPHHRCCIDLRSCYSLLPYLSCIPKSLAANAALVKALNIKQTFDAADYTTVLHMIWSKWHDENKLAIPLDDADLDIVIDIINTYLCKIHNLGHHIKTQNLEVYLPNTKGILYTSTSLCFNNCPWIIEKDCAWLAEENCCHVRIPYSSLEPLHVRLIRQDMLRKRSSPMCFGQSEKLCNRLKRILMEYPLGVEILKEMLQNADDAGATGLQFIKDARQLPMNKLFDDSWKPLQGPALCIYNNKPFTEDDFAAIQNLGEGNKSGDPNKIGQFGVGFNCVYNLCDVPSILTTIVSPNGHQIRKLCVFDPNCKFVPDVCRESPGCQYSCIDELKIRFPDIFEGYMEGIYGNDGGTFIRLPLRNPASAALSDISKKTVDFSDIDKLFDDFKTMLHESLLFTSNVASIQLREMTELGTMKEIYSVKLLLSAEAQAKRENFCKKVRDVSASIKGRRTRIEDIEMFEVSYEMETVDSSGLSITWLITNRIGFQQSSDVPESLAKVYFADEILLLPIAGCAFPFCINQDQAHEENFISRPKLFCFLPLPITLDNGIPFHINGHFALDLENRRNLAWDARWKSKLDWNCCLIENVVAPAYCSLLEFIRDRMFLSDRRVTRSTSNHVNTEALVKYYKLFPTCNMRQQYNNTMQPEYNGGHMQTIVRAVYKSLVKTKLKILPASVEVLQCGKHIISWIGAMEPELQCGYFFSGTNIDKILIDCGLAVFVECPREIIKNFQAADPSVQVVSPDTALNFFASYQKPGSSCRIALLPAPITDTPFKSCEVFFEILKYCWNNCQWNKSRLIGLPLLLTNNEILKSFDSQNLLYLIPLEYSDIFSNCLASAIHRTVVSVLNLDPKQDRNLCKEVTILDLSLFLPDMLPERQFKLSGAENSVNHITTSSLDAELKNKGSKLDAGTWLRQVWRYIEYLQTSTCQIACLNDWFLFPVITSEHRGEVLLPMKMRSVVVRNLETVRQYAAKHYISRRPKRHEKITQPSIPGLPDDIDTLLDVLKLYRPSKPFFSDFKIYEELIINNSLPTSVICALTERVSSHIPSINPHIGWHSLRHFLSENRYDIISASQCHMMLKLPMFTTVTKQLVALEEYCGIYTLPENIETCELESLTCVRADKLIFLSQMAGTDELLQYLKDKGYCNFLQSFTNVEFYIQFVFQQFEHFSEEARYIHMIYVHDAMVKTFKNLNQRHFTPTIHRNLYQHEFDILINALKLLAFLPDKNGSLCSAKHFYNPNNPVFVAMEMQLPPERYSSEEWLGFLAECGLISVLTEDMALNFINLISAEAAASVAIDAAKRVRQLKAQSEAIVKNLMGKEEGEYSDIFWQQVKDIAFVEPRKVDRRLEKLCPQFGKRSDKGNLMFLPLNFSATVIGQDHLLYTAQPLLSQYIYGSRDTSKYGNFCNKCGIVTEVEPEIISRNLDILCTHILLNEGPRDVKEADFIRDILKQILSFIKANIEKFPEEAIKVVKETCCIVLDDNVPTMIKPNQIVLELIEEIKPYLCRLPWHLKELSDFLITLSATKTATIDQYVNVLCLIKTKYPQPPKRESDSFQKYCEAVETATRGLFRTIQKTDKEIPIIINDDLYLPASDMKLHKSCDLVLINRGPSFKDRVAKLELPFLVDLDRDCKMQISPQETEALANRIDVLHRPMLLSGIVNERLTTVEPKLMDLPMAEVMQGKLRSKEFGEALIALACDMSLKGNVQSHCSASCKLEAKESIVQKLSSIKVVGVEDVVTKLLHKGREIPGSTRQLPYFAEKIENWNGCPAEWKIYISGRTKGDQTERKTSEQMNMSTGVANIVFESNMADIVNDVTEGLQLKLVLNRVMALIMCDVNEMGVLLDGFNVNRDGGNHSQM